MKNLNDEPPVVGRSKAAAAKAEAAEFRASLRADRTRKEALKIEGLTLVLDALKACQPLGIAAIAAKTASIAGNSARAEKRANALLDVELGLMAQISGARMPEELKALEAKLAVVRKESASVVVVDSYDTTESFETRKGVSKTYER